MPAAFGDARRFVLIMERLHWDVAHVDKLDVSSADKCWTAMPSYLFLPSTSQR
jgi:hypothetical protein